jgi:hypothetical protein
MQQIVDLAERIFNALVELTERLLRQNRARTLVNLFADSAALVIEERVTRALTRR